MTQFAKKLEVDLDKSRSKEMEVYLDSMSAMYSNSIAQNGEIYDIAFDLTKEFKKISSKAITEDSRIIKMLRYSIAPSISQMKFGQMFSVRTSQKFEKDRLSAGTNTYKELKKMAPSMARFWRKHIDKTRFIWLEDASLDSDLAREFAKNWSCSIAADQNAQTSYRSWRKERQEQSVVAKLVSMGYVKSSFRGTLKKITDLKIGEYTLELKIKGRTVQKADAVFRSRTSKKLILIEAKAVGVELDATKRIKECCDKTNDWRSSNALESPEVVAVIAGFFKKVNIENLLASGANVVWEHDLDALERYA